MAAVTTMKMVGRIKFHPEHGEPIDLGGIEIEVPVQIAPQGVRAERSVGVAPAVADASFHDHDSFKSA